ncbi:MAG: cupin domain-containing protein [Spirochaetales bacterium]|nr:cupin domain-containing protein [Spirochaetales bacterium]
MEVIKCWEEQGETIPEPYVRHIKVMLAPDRRNVPEITFSHAIIYPHSKTDYHTHDRPELIQILSGRGISVCDGVETPVEPDMALWVRAGEMHQVINTGEESIKLATVFVPGYTAKENLERIVEAARKAKKGGG